MNAPTTIVFSFIGGPMDGEKTQLPENPNSILFLEGDQSGYAYCRSGNEYRWTNRFHVTPRREPVTTPRFEPLAPLPAPPINWETPPPLTPPINWQTPCALFVLALIFVAGLFAIVPHRSGRENTTIPAPTPLPTPATTPLPIPPSPNPLATPKTYIYWENDTWIHSSPQAPAPHKVRRAESVVSDIAPGKPFPSGMVHMPYGEDLFVTVWGRVANQESLPQGDNRIGDAYVVGKDIFVWVAPGGRPQWVDPVTQ